MDAPTLSTFLSPILTVTTVWNTGETGDIDAIKSYNEASSSLVVQYINSNPCPLCTKHLK